MATGGSTTARRLYSDDDENIITLHNPVMLNGIGSLVIRPDLLERTITLNLPPVKERLSQDTINGLQQQFMPSIFGALLDIFTGTLQKLPEVQAASSELPRMIDFALLGESMSRHLGHPDGYFIDAFRLRRKEAVRNVIDASPVSLACLALLEREKSYAGPIGKLLDRLSKYLQQRGDRTDWPSTPRGLGNALRRCAPALREIGVMVHIDNRPKRDGYHCTLNYADGVTAVAGDLNNVHPS
jgi:hypothetical protein